MFDAHSENLRLRNTLLRIDSRPAPSNRELNEYSSRIAHNHIAAQKRKRDRMQRAIEHENEVRHDVIKSNSSSRIPKLLLRRLESVKPSSAISASRPSPPNKTQHSPLKPSIRTSASSSDLSIAAIVASVPDTDLEMTSKPKSAPVRKSSLVVLESSATKSQPRKQSQLLSTSVSASDLHTFLHPQKLDSSASTASLSSTTRTNHYHQQQLEQRSSPDRASTSPPRTASSAPPPSAPRTAQPKFYHAADPEPSQRMDADESAMWAMITSSLSA